MTKEFDSLLRADLATRMKARQKGVNAGLITPNEARALEGCPSMPGGGQLLMNGTTLGIPRRRRRNIRGNRDDQRL